MWKDFTKRIQNAKGSHKKWIFYGQADCKGGGGSAPSALTVSKCENFDPFFFNGIRLYDTQYTFYLIVRGLTNAFLVPLTPLLYRYLTVLWEFL